MSSKWLCAKGVSPFSLLLVLVAVGSGALFAYGNPLNTVESQPASEAVASFLKHVRLKAITSSSAYFVVPVSENKLVAKFSSKCSDRNPALDPQIEFKLPSGANLSSTAWIACFSSQGQAEVATKILISDHGDSVNSDQTVQVLVGGSVKVGA